MSTGGIKKIYFRHLRSLEREIEKEIKLPYGIIIKVASGTPREDVEKLVEEMVSSGIIREDGIVYVDYVEDKYVEDKGGNNALSV